MAIAQEPQSDSAIARIKFKADARVNLGRELLDKVNSARNGMRELLKRQETWMALYESDLPAKDFPWDGCANVCIPVIQSHVDTWHASINDIMTSPRPWMVVSAPTNLNNVPNIKDGALAVQDALYQVQDTVMGLRGVIDRWNLNSLMQQAGIIKLRWAEEYRSVKRKKQAVDELTGLPAVDPTTGKPIIKAQIEKEPKYRGPKPEIVDLHNFVIFPLTAQSIEDAQMVGDRYRLTADQIKRRIKDGIWDKEQGDQVLARMGNEAGTPKEIDDNLDDREGVELLSDYESLWFWELIAPYDADGDGLTEDCVFTVEAESGIIVRATEFPYYHGRRYYIAQRPFPRPRQRFFGRCLPQMLEHLQREINAIHNQRVDATSLSISAPFLRLRSSDVDSDAIKFFPGAEIPVDSMDEIQQLPISPIIPGLDVEENDKDWTERASPINDIAMGRTTEGEKKTLGEVQITSQKSALRVADVVARLQEEGMTELAQQTIGLMYQFFTDEELDFYNLTRDLLTIPWDIIPYGNIATADKQLKRQEADFLYMLMTGGAGAPPNPLVVNNPMRLYRLTQDLLQGHERKDVDNYIGTEEELQAEIEQQAQQQAMMQQQQAQMAQEQAAMQQQEQAQGAEREQADKQADRDLKREQIQMQMQAAMMKQQQQQQGAPGG